MLSSNTLIWCNGIVVVGDELAAAPVEHEYDDENSGDARYDQEAVD